MNLPNRLTILRVILVPFFVVFMLVPSFGQAGRYIALAIFIIASITDTLDGMIARRCSLITDFGKFADPLADKLLVSSALLCMCGDEIPVWVVIIIIARDYIINGLRIIAADKDVVIAADIWGKAKTMTQMIMIIVLLADIDLPVFFVLGQILIYVSVALTVISLVESIIKNRSVFSDV